jgi:dimethylhistidine N-methyltransferase
VKNEFLIGALIEPRGYVPIDISKSYLEQTTKRIRDRFPSMWVEPVERDFLTAFEMPVDMPAGRRIGFFPGSTIGNLDIAEATAFLGQMRHHVRNDGGAFVGVDLRKDVGTLMRAYDDRDGVTAQFNLNILARINRELEGNFQLAQFRHAVRWNVDEAAMEMHLVSNVDQTVLISGFEFWFEQGESIHTESSRKFDRRSFESLARGAGWRIDSAWGDTDGLFSVFGLVPG